MNWSEIKWFEAFETAKVYRTPFNISVERKMDLHKETVGGYSCHYRKPDFYKECIT